MEPTIKPGDMGLGFDDTKDSIAEAIDLELNRLLLADGLNGLSMDMTIQDNRSRRRLFVAIARGLMQHLVANRNAFNFATTDLSPIIPREIRTAGL